MRHFWISIVLVMAVLLVGCAPAAQPTPVPQPEARAEAPAAPAAPVAPTATVAQAAAPQPTAVPTEAPRVLAPGSVQLTGAGASFPFPLYSRWFYEYAFVNPVARFNYQSIGSGGGIRQITARTVDFGGSDALLNDEMKAVAPGLMQLPTVAGAVVVAYNVTDTAGEAIPSGLQLTPEAISGIFLGEINNWSDPLLVELNPDAKLPNQEIVVARRSDGSGTTFLFTSYLSQVNEDWRNSVGAGTAVEWPVGLGGKGNEGVAGIVKQQPGSVGYVELAYATENKLSYATVQNKAGNYVVPSLASTTAASDAAVDDMPEDLGQLLVNAPGADSYPIAGYTFLLVYEEMEDCDKAAQLINFVSWALSDEGDRSALELQYAPLGLAVQGLVFERLDNMTCGGGQPVPQQ
jgi:phosphate transport system substrate-binding protein